MIFWRKKFNFSDFNYFFLFFFFYIFRYFMDLLFAFDVFFWTFHILKKMFFDLFRFSDFSDFKKVFFGGGMIWISFQSYKGYY